MKVGDKVLTHFCRAYDGTVHENYYGQEGTIVEKTSSSNRLLKNKWWVELYYCANIKMPFSEEELTLIIDIF